MKFNICVTDIMKMNGETQTIKTEQKYIYNNIRNAVL